jgi:hypothetical protein
MSNSRNHGGKRPGAGRPKGFDKERARARLREMVWAEMDAMTEAQIANAKGIKYLVAREKKTGKFLRVADVRSAVKSGEEVIEVWEKDPSVHAYADLMDRALDKAAQPLKGEPDSPLELRISWQK